METRTIRFENKGKCLEWLMYHNEPVYIGGGWDNCRAALRDILTCDDDQEFSIEAIVNDGYDDVYYTAAKLGIRHLAEDIKESFTGIWTSDATTVAFDTWTTGGHHINVNIDDDYITIRINGSKELRTNHYWINGDEAAAMVYEALGRYVI